MSKSPYMTNLDLRVSKLWHRCGALALGPLVEDLLGDGHVKFDTGPIA